MCIGSRFQLPVPEVSVLLTSVFSFKYPTDYINFSGAATTASRLGQPDLAIATLNDFTEVIFPVFSTTR